MKQAESLERKCYLPHSDITMLINYLFDKNVYTMQYTHIKNKSRLITIMTNVCKIKCNVFRLKEEFHYQYRDIFEKANHLFLYF